MKTTMIICLIAVFSASGFAQDKNNVLTKKEKKEGWVLLFDGKTTDGWRSYNKTAFPEKGWVVEEGTLHVIGSSRGEAGGGGGDLLFDKKFRNFELSLEWKVSEGGNSGIFYLAQEIPGEPVWKSAPEMQILDVWVLQHIFKQASVSAQRHYLVSIGEVAIVAICAHGNSRGHRCVQFRRVHSPLFARVAPKEFFIQLAPDLVDHDVF